MRVAASIIGALLVAFILVDAFNTTILARKTRHSFRITRGFYRFTWKPYAAIGRRIRSSERREGFLSIYGPLSFILILALWAAGLVIGFAFVQWAVGLQPGKLRPGFGNDLYLSATALFTVHTGDPQNAVSKCIAVVEPGLGFSLLGLVISNP